jgi:hypothetical protein
VTVTEACDGDDLGTTTCSSLGWGSGTLGCDPRCKLVDDRCSECVLGQGVANCGDAPIGAGLVQDFALAGTDAAVGLAWGDGEPAGPVTFHLAQLSPDLGVVTVSELGLKTNHKIGPGEGAIAIAPLASGWIAARALQPEIAFQSVDATGTVLTQVAVDSVPGILSDTVLVPRPGGGPLLLWTGTSGVRAAVIADDARTATTPVDLSGWASVFSGTFANGAFYVVIADSAAGGRLVRVETDGTVKTAVDLAKSLISPTLVSGAADLRVLFTTPEARSLLWQRLDSNGAALASSVRLGDFAGVPENLALAMGGDTILAYPSAPTGLTNPVSVSLARVDAYGVRQAQVTVARWPRFGVSPMLALRGPDAVVGWLTGGRVRLARATP